jgi:protein-S-isoprenylcysteine O-methyltransferase Ste14
LPANTQQDENLGQVVTEVTERVSILVRDEIELAKAEVTTKVSSIARGAIAVGIGAVLGVFALIYGLLAVAWAINQATGDLWPGFVIVFGLLLLLTIFAFLFAWRKLRVGPPTPQMAIDEAKLIRETVQTEVDR